MASAYSSPANFGKTVSTLDIAQLTGTVQSAMQQTYSQNVSKVDELINQFTSVPLVRASDKKYLGERLQTLLSSVDKNVKSSWVSGNVTREVANHISSAIDDNVLKQMSNSQAIINFEQTAAEKKAKNPDLYNDANYMYAKDKAGYEAYMKGETDSIGSLQYVDYYDVNKHLTQEVEKFAKDRGYERVLSDDNNEYIYKTVHGKKVSPEEIGDYIKTKIDTDVRLKQQLLINSHAENRGFTDEQVLQKYSEFVNKEAQGYEEKIKVLQNQKKNTNPDDVATLQALDSAITQTDTYRKSLLAQAKPENFDRDAVQYTNYKNTLINNHAKTFSYEDITDVKFDDYQIKMMKAQGKLSTDGTPSVGVAGVGAGQMVERSIEDTPEGEVKDKFTQFYTDREKVWTDMTSHMKARLKAEGKEPSVANQNAYYAGLKKAVDNGIDLNASGYSSEDIKLYKKVEAYNKENYRMMKVAEEAYGDASEKTLDGLFGGKSKDLNVDGLATTMPYTAGLLKKYNSSEQLSKKERDLALYEIAKNAKDTLIDDDKAKKQVELYMSLLERENSFTKEDLKTNLKTTEQPGFWSGTWDAAKGVANVVGGYLGSVTAGVTNFRPESYEQSINQSAKQAELGSNQFGKGATQVGKWFSNKFVTDADLADIQSGDINLANYGDPRKLFSQASGRVKDLIDTSLTAQTANLPKESSLVFNPNIKTDKPYVEQFKNILVANGANPTNDTYISVDKIENGVATVRFQENTKVASATKGVMKDAKQETVREINVSTLPKEVVKNIETELTDFTFSVRNPQPLEVKVAYSPPNDFDSLSKMTNNYLNSYGNEMSEAQIALLQRQGLPYKTKEAYLKEASVLSPEYFNQFKEDLSHSYTVAWERPKGGGAFIGRIVKRRGADDPGKIVSEPFQEGQDYNPHVYAQLTTKYIDNYIQGRLVELRMNQLRNQR